MYYNCTILMKVKCHFLYYYKFLLKKGNELKCNKVSRPDRCDPYTDAIVILSMYCVSFLWS